MNNSSQILLAVLGGIALLLGLLVVCKLWILDKGDLLDSKVRKTLKVKQVDDSDDEAHPGPPSVQVEMTRKSRKSEPGPAPVLTIKEAVQTSGANIILDLTGDAEDKSDDQFVKGAENLIASKKTSSKKRDSTTKLEQRMGDDAEVMEEKTAWGKYYQ